MASFIPGLGDEIVQGPQFNPDFNTMERLLRRKDQMYEQGFNRVQSAQNSIASLELTDPANQIARAKYLEQAEKNLQELSTTDLSLPENVQAAENVYAPFWEDNMMLMDAGYTKHNKSQIEQLMSWKNSKDDKVRAQYSDITLKYLSNDIDNLKGAGRNPEAYSRFEMRRAVPFKDKMAYLEEMAGKDPEKLKIVWSEEKGPYLISQTNGERSEKNFRVWAEAMLGNKFDEQDGVTGIVEKEERLKYIKATNPVAAGMNDQEVIRNFMAKGIVSEIKQGYTKRTATLDAEMSTLQKALEKMPEVLDANSAQTAAYYVSQIEQLKNMKAGIEDEYKVLNFTKIEDDIANNPAGYFKLLSKDRDINNWAAARASIQSYKIEKNSAWFDAEELRQKDSHFQQQMQLERQKIQNESRNKSTKTSTGSSSDDDTETPVNDGGRYVGAGSTDLSKEGSVLEVYNKKLNDLYVSAHDNLYDPNGFLGLLRNVGNITQDDIVSLSSYLRKEARNPTTYVEGTPEERKAVGKVVLELSNKMGNKNLTGPKQLRNLIIDYGSQYLKSKISRNEVPDAEESRAIIEYTAGKQSLEEHNALIEERDKRLEQLVKAPSAEISNIVIKKNGKNSLLSSEDISKEFSHIQVRDKKTGKITSMEKLNIGNDYMSNKPISTSQTTRVNEYGVPSYEFTYSDSNGNTYEIVNLSEFNQAKENVEKLYGTSEKVKKSFDKINEQIIPDLGYFKSQTGKMGSVFKYDLTDVNKKGIEQGVKLIQESLIPSNNISVVDDSGRTIPQEELNALQLLSKGSEEDIRKRFNGIEYHTQNETGNPYMTITLKPLSEQDKTVVGNVDLNKLSSKTFKVALSPAATGSTLTELPRNTGFYVYNRLLRGQSIQADDVIKSSGFDFQITPNDRQNPTNARMEIKYKVFNTQTGKLEDKSNTEVYSLSDKNPDELVSFVYQQFNRITEFNRQAKEQYDQYLKSVSPVSSPQAPAVFNKSDILRK